jgi:hypothetical protein
MSLSKGVIETLIDLVEIKLSCIEVYDREDKREIAALERCRQELKDLFEGKAEAAGAVVTFPPGLKAGSRAAV